MERIEQLEKEIRILSASLRVGTALLIAGFSAQCWFILSRAGEFRMIYRDLLGPDSRLPAMTALFVNNATAIMLSVLIGGAFAIALLCVKRARVWSVPLGIAVAVVTIGTAQFARFSLDLPMIGIMGQLSK
jgi:hypothetical protein